MVSRGTPRLLGGNDSLTSFRVIRKTRRPLGGLGIRDRDDRVSLTTLQPLMQQQDEQHVIREGGSFSDGHTKSIVWPRVPRQRTDMLTGSDLGRHK